MFLCKLSWQQAAEAFGRRALGPWAIVMAVMAVVLQGCGGGGSAIERSTITTQPASVVVSVGQSAVFTVQAQGFGSLSFQWYRGGMPVPGAVGNTLAIGTTALTDNDTHFFVRVCHFGVCADSKIASLSVVVQALAPLITAAPRSQQVLSGDPVEFVVEATGTQPLRYQWRRGGVAVSGATDPTYRLDRVALTDDGALIDVLVSNTAGRAQAGAALRVDAGPVAPSLADMPSSVAVPEGNDAIFSVVASGTQPLRYQWYRNDEAVVGATGSFYVLGNTAAADDGARFAVTVANAAGTIAGPPTTLNVSRRLVAPQVVTSPQAASVNVGAAALFSVSATGTQPLAYQWKRNGVEIAGANRDTLVYVAVNDQDNGALLSVSVSNLAGTAVSAAAMLTIGNLPVAPVITAHPQSTAVQQGRNVTFTVVATGTAGLSYQWLRDGTPIASANGPSMAMTAASADNGARFSVRVSNAAGLAISADALLVVTPAPIAPLFELQPADRAVFAGQVATFVAVVAGTAPMSYQWRRDGVDIPGATAAFYATGATALADSGARFILLASNAAGAATSAAAALTVGIAPTAPLVTAQPQNVTTNAGLNATFSVAASGTAVLGYQWRRDGVDIPGAASASYSISPRGNGLDNGAQFSVLVFNQQGSALSNAATLTVNPLWTPAQATSKFLWLDVNDAASLTVDASGTISQWRDKSGMGQHAYALSPTEQPAYAAGQLNGHAVASFDGINNRLIANVALNQNYVSVFAVHRKAVGGFNYSRVISLSNTSDEVSGADWNTNNGWVPIEYRSGDNTVASERAGAVIGLPSARSVWGLTASIINGSQIVFAHNGDVTNGTTSSTSLNSNRCVIGSNFANEALNGDIAEVLVINEALTDADRQRVEGYLAHKWGLTANLPRSHPYKSVPPS